MRRIHQMSALPPKADIRPRDQDVCFGTVYRLTVNDVPVDAFWSISLYNAEGHFQKNAFDAYTLNSIDIGKNSSQN